MLSSKEEIIAWVDGLKAFDAGDYERALELFSQVADYSKILFNMGMIYSRLDEQENAIQLYTDALRVDPYLAVAYYQRGYCYFLVDDYRNSYEDYSQALELLLENDAIDYNQLGLKYQLYRCELLFNRAMSLQQMGADAEAYADIQEARKIMRTPEQRAVVERAARIGVDEENLTLFTVPVDGLFHVKEEKVKNLGKKHFMKEATIVASRDDDDYIGFSGAQILVGTGTVGRKLTLDTRGRDEEVSSTLKSTRSRSANGQAAQYPREADYGKGFQATLPPPLRTRANTLNDGPIMTNGRSTQNTKINQRQSSLINRTPVLNAPPIRSLPRQLNGKGTNGTIPREKSSDVNYSPPSTSPLKNDDTISRKETMKTKLKVKIHNGESEIVVIYVEKDISSIIELAQRVQDKLKMRNAPLLQYQDFDDDQNESSSLVTIVDDDDLAMVLDNLPNGSPLQVWVKQRKNTRI
ncbi:hypothetical protein HK098_005301 [Nowakowskiella sp. JEL0407]|nr:hypothetical protein HK098_005301 [Nowakowskiella sp. JEL0407]